LLRSNKIRAEGILPDGRMRLFLRFPKPRRACLFLSEAKAPVVKGTFSAELKKIASGRGLGCASAGLGASLALQTLRPVLDARQH